MGKLLLMFMLLPAVELYLLVRLGRAYGGALPVLWVIVSACVGLLCARLEGLRVLRQWRTALATGAAPEQGVMSGVLVLLGSALLVLPGVISDVLGLALFLPFVRRAVSTLVLRRVQRAIANGGLHVAQAHSWAAPPSPFRREPAPAGDVIDAESETVAEPRKLSS